MLLQKPINEGMVVWDTKYLLYDYSSSGNMRTVQKTYYYSPAFERIKGSGTPLFAMVPPSDIFGPAMECG